MRTNVDIVFSAQTQATANSAAFDTSSVVAISLQMTFTDGAAAGTVKLQASNDNTNPTVWSDVASQTATVAAGATVLIPKFDISYQWMRAVWTSTGGAGTMTAKVKTVGF